MLVAGIALSILIAPQDIDRAARHVEYVVEATTAAEEDGVIPLRVSMRMASPPRPRAVVQIPVWAPGSYRLRVFPDRIRDVTARAGDRVLPVRRLNRHSYEIVHGDELAVQVDYTVEMHPNDRFMQSARSRRCLTYEGPAVYMYEREMKTAPCTVRFALPDGWKAISGLVRGDDDTWFAEDYDFLADCPVKIGQFQTWRFESHGKPIDVVVDAPEDLDFDPQPWLDNIRAVTDVQGAMFGGFPFDRYTFLFTAAPRGGGGGLEHLTSTAIGLSARRLPADPTTGIGTVAHEFFHLWNVKRIRPRALGPFDYTRPNRTTMLWLLEGITSYYGTLTQVRAGLRPGDSFWRSMAGQIRTLESSAAREHVSSSEASWRVWDPKPSDRALNYYNSGLVLGFLLDVEIRASSRNMRSLDDLMRGLYTLCEDRGRGFDDRDVPRLVRELAGRSYDAWFDAHVSGTVVPDYATTLAKAGLTYHEERVRRNVIRGISSAGAGETRHAWWTDPDASGRRARFRQGRVVAVGDTKTEGYDAVVAAIDAATSGSTVALGIVRTDGTEVDIEVTLDSVPRCRVEITLDADADAAAIAIREGLLAGEPSRAGF